MAKSNVSPTIKREIFEYAMGCCEYCRNQQRFSTAPFSIEHIWPSSKGGTDDKSNLACSCPACNFHKFTKTSGYDSLTRQFVPLFNPRNDIWEDNFTWDDTYTRIYGTTPIGRATVHALNMNREESVNLRRVLVSFGEHPPV